MPKRKSTARDETKNEEAKQTIEERRADGVVLEDYRQYAQYILRNRALPDVRDGLKPVQRRILYAMYDMGLRPNSPSKKSARIVGEVLGKYHPHGDSAIYEAMVRMAQPFTLPYPLVKGQGNFGSVDGDNAAAMRYTEAKLSEYGMYMLGELAGVIGDFGMGAGDKGETASGGIAVREVVDWEPNFDGTLLEPVTLPARLPFLVLNGSVGIAAANISVSIPPHNIGEVLESAALIAQRKAIRRAVRAEDLHISGPDFPTGGIIAFEKMSQELVYEKGNGSFYVYPRAEIVKRKVGRSNRTLVVITELPPGPKQTALRALDKLRQNKDCPYTSIRDESDRSGIVIVLTPKRGSGKAEETLAVVQRTLRHTYPVNFNVVVGEHVRRLGMLQLLEAWVEYRAEVLGRYGHAMQERLEARMTKLEGIEKALLDIDRLVAIVRRSRSLTEAQGQVVAEMDLTQEQARAVLTMPLYRLAKMELEKVRKEIKSLKRARSRYRRLAESAAACYRAIYTDMQNVLHSLPQETLQRRSTIRVR